ncbi:MAG TPA: hypothetical protein VIG06_23930 [Kofleriaceae bacterium]|jgi:hypothetical protein
MTNHILLRLLVLSASLASSALSACATAADDDRGSLPVSEMPSCSPNQANLSGTVDGVKVEAAATAVVSRASIDSFLDVDLATGDHLTIAWDGPLHDGVAAGATGVLDSPTASYATCVRDVLPGLVQLDEATGAIYFDLSDLRRDGLCDGALAGGELAGCVGPPVALVAD